MPPKKKGRTTKAKPKLVCLTAEEQQLRDQCDLLLKDFDKQCENTVKEAWREVDTVAKSINTLYKLELLKMPQEVKDMKWDDYYQQSMNNGENPLALSEAIGGLINDSICANVDSQVSQLRSAMKSTTKKNKKKGGNQPASTVRASSRKKATSDNEAAGSNTATRSSSRSRTRGIDESSSAMATPANTRPPPNMGKTPLITPKFDTSSLSRTVSRVAKANEVLVSLSGSPVVMPTRSRKPKASKVPVNEFDQVTLAGGSTLNVPLVEDGGVDPAYLDDEQLDKLDALQKSLANMVRARREADNGSGEGEL